MNSGHPKPNTRVTIMRMVNRPELNGRFGKITKYYKKTGRYGVILLQGNNPSEYMREDGPEFAITENNFEVLKQKY